MTQMAMDVHKTRSTIAYVTPGMTEPKVVRCFSTLEGFREVLEGLPEPWVVCVESSRQSPAVVRWLRDLGVEEIHLVNAQELHRFVEGKPKTDARDAKEMLDLKLMNRLPECYLATQAVEDQRALTRGRAFMRRMSTSVRNMIRAVLNQHGLVVQQRDLQGAAAQEKLAELLLKLGPLAQLVLGQLIMLLRVIEESLKVVDKQINAEAAQQPAAQALMELPGIGSVLALSLVAEIGDIERFEDPEHLHSYAGLAPRADDTGDYSGPRHLPKRCNKRLRNLAIQATQCAVRSQADSRARTTYHRLTQRLRPNSAKVAASRVLMKDVFYRWKQAVTATRLTA